MKLTKCQEVSLEVLENWYRSNETTASLIGAAGTGKTTLAKYFLDKVKPKCTVTAPTHKARFVIQRAIGRNSDTIQRILGLQPDFNIENFNINSPTFAMKGRVKIEGDLLLIDEASMINKQLKDYLELLSKDFNFKILFMGDKRQLPPVGESTSSAFNDVKVITELRTLVRQSNVNPLMLILLALRLDIAFLCGEQEPETVESLIELVKQQNISVTPDDIIAKKNQGQLFKLLLLANVGSIKDGQGVQFVRTAKEFEDNIKLEFKADKESTRLLAFTNDRVTKWNRFIRNNVVNPYETEYITKGDILMGYMNNGVIYNGCDYLVKEAIPEVFENIPVYRTKLNEVGTDFNSNIFMVRYTEQDCYESFQKAHEANHKRARVMRGNNWQTYYDWRKQFSVPISMNTDEYVHTELMIEPNNLPKKDVDYGYSITIHKSQGSTFNNVLVDVDDLISVAKRDKVMFYKLLYVACSRAKGRCIIYFPR
jgi:exodeoxyribonuclease-5